MTVVMIAASTCVAIASADTYPVRWFYLTTNLLKDETTDKSIQLVREAAAAGLNGVVLVDSKLGTLELYGYDRPGHAYRRNIDRFLAECRRHHIEVIPHVPEVARGDSILAYNVNLAAGFEVRNAVFAVQDGMARLVPDTTVSLAGGDFEKVNGTRLAGWKYQDAPGETTIQDTGVAHSGQASVRLEPVNAANRMCRLNQLVRVMPHRCYRVTVLVKTQRLDRPDSFRVSVKGVSEGEPRSLTFDECLVKPTQDWTRYDVVFNSRNYDSVAIQMGLWGAGNGTAWVDDAELVEIGLVNILRREGCPLRVTASDGTAFQEGRDFEPVADPLLGRAKGWPGTYDSYHREPVIRMKRTVPNGTRLSVSYFHAMQTGGGHADCCLTEPQVDEIFEQQLGRIVALLDSPRYFLLGIDELRTAGGCAWCQASGKTPGQLLAEHVRRFTAITRKVRPGAELIVWHDMFDPASHGQRKSNLVDGSFEGSWEGLESSVIVCAWSHATREESLRFFSGRHHRLIASANVQKAADPGRLLADWLNVMADTPGVLGAMHTSWDLDRQYFSEFGTALAARQVGRLEAAE